MPVTAGDIKFFAADSAGARAGTVVQDGLNQNVFPDVSTADRLGGSISEKTVYLSAANADTDPLRGVSVAINEVPTDPTVSVWLGKPTYGAGAAATFPFGAGPYSGYTATLGSATITKATHTSSMDTYIPDWPFLIWEDGGNPVRRVCLRRVTAVPSSGGDLVLNKPMPFSGPVRIRPLNAFAAPITGYIRGANVTEASTSSGSDQVIVSTLVKADSLAEDTPRSFNASVPEPTDLSCGHRFAYPIGTQVTLYHEAETTAGTLTNGQVVNVGRTDIDQFAVVDSNGAEVARVLLNGPSLASVTPNFAAGTLTINSVTGWSMPCKVRHRIVHRTSVGHADARSRVTLGTVVTRTFPAGSVLAGHASLPDLQAAVTLMFAQQAWTGTWSDSLIGNGASLPYVGTIGIANQGAETDRYRIVFKTATTFSCFAERRGQLPDGSTATTYAPANTTLGGVLLTLAAAGWAPSVPVGTVLRINTVAAAAPLVVSRAVARSVGAPSGSTYAALRAYGSP